MKSIFGDNSDIKDMLDGGEDISLMRIFHYFGKNKKSELENMDKVILGSSPHRDWGLLTLILQDSPGLEYLDDSDGEWKAVPFVPGSLVVNGGDFLNLIAQSREALPIKSPIHRVLSPEQENRLSFVFFYYPKYQTQVPDPAVNFGGTDQVDESVPDFNTLTSILNDRDEVAPITFGDAMIEKWKGVSTVKNDL